MKIISKVSVPHEKANIYFAVDLKNPIKPFIFGAECNDPDLPSVAQWACASRFGIDNLDNIDGSKWKDWRATLKKLNCEWVIPIFEKAQLDSDLQFAISEIINK